MKNSKPRNCTFFLKNACNRGDQCPYSHVKPPIGPQLSVQPAPPQNGLYRQTCAFWTAGKCTRGSQCTFLHPDAASSAHANLIPTPPTCIYWAQGNCTKRAQCTFFHDLSVPVPLARPPVQITSGDSSLSPHALVADPRKSLPCKFWKRGRCDKGDGCEYQHGQAINIDDGSIEVQPVPSPYVVETPPTAIAEKPIQKTILNSARAVFGPGLSVEQVITVFESCRISVSNLVTSVSDEELRTMAEPFGTIISAHVLPGPTKTGLVTFPSPFEASHAVKSLDGTMVRSKKISARLELHSANSGVPTLRNSTVKLSWFTPTRIAWAHYSAVTLAKRKAADLNGKTFDDRKLTVIFQQPSYHQRESFSIVIKGLPPAAKLEHLKKFFGTNNIKLGEPNYSAFTGRKKVREILETFGELEAFDILPRQGADAKFKALARFKTSEAAVSATSALHGKQQTSLGQCPLWLELVLSLKYTVPLQQYNYQKTQFDQIRLSQSDEGSHAKLAVYDEDEEGKKVDPVCIRIYGDNAKALSKIKVTVDKLIAGQKLMDGGKIVWDDYLDTPASQIFLARVIKETGVFVKKDSRQRTLFLYGAPDANALARPLIQDELKRRKDDETVIPLDASMLRYLLTKGMEQLTAEAGLDSVPSLNVVTRELAVRGSDESRRLVQFSLRSQSLALDAGHEDATQDDSDCPVCMCSPTNGVDLPCGHKYCYTCLKFFLARAADVKVFPIACLAAEGQCGGTVSLETIRDFLSPAEEENLLNTAFLAYIHEHPTDFRYCPTPDCPQIYRPGAEGTVLQCPSCVARICPACHVPYHEGLSCVEQRDGIDSDRLFKEWSDAHGAKACPSCSAVIQKSEGCNHMTCSVCKTHICWVCMGTFPKEIIYNHMTQKHGGIGLRLERFM